MKVRGNGIEIFYEKIGTGRPMVLVHGIGQDHSVFDALIEKLKAHYTIYAMDCRNHGQSDASEDCSYDAMAEDVYQLIRELNLGKVYLIGFSDGAVVALHVALAHLDVLEKVAFLGVNLKPTDLREKSLEYFRKSYEETGNPHYHQILVLPQIEQEELADITIPTLLAEAERDIFRDGLFEELSRAFPNVRAQRMMGHKHETYLVHNDLLYPDLLDFFGES
ncbi:MAG: hypothetical protein H6Q61_1123 [Firmicutes bacterium]|nr:hypothetical protein [Bacillota bacterium]